MNIYVYFNSNYGSVYMHFLGVFEIKYLIFDFVIYILVRNFVMTSVITSHSQRSINNHRPHAQHHESVKVYIAEQLKGQHPYSSSS